MTERLKVPVLKTGKAQAFVGSNPTPSATPPTQSSLVLTLVLVIAPKTPPKLGSRLSSLVLGSRKPAILSLRHKPPFPG